jgi:hypothetical protein
MIGVFSLFLPAEIPKAFFVACGILIITLGYLICIGTGACITGIILFAA